MSGNLGANLINQLQNTPMASPDYWTHQMANMNALQDYNAKQAWGQALQQATDPTTGQVDYPRAQAIAAGNPMARAGMAKNLANTSTIQGQQIEQSRLNLDLVGQLSASGMKDTSNANMANIRAQAVNSGAPPGAIAELDRIAALPENQRANEFYNHNVSSLDALGRIHRQMGVTTAENIGGANVAQTVTQGSPGQPGSVTQGTGGITRTLSPESENDIVEVQFPDHTTKQMARPDAVRAISQTPGATMGATVVSGSEAPINAAGDSATRKASEGGPPAPNTPAAAVAQRTHDFWISQGYNEAQVAGILAGGPGSESNFNPSVSGDKGTSYGLYQHHAERLAAMQKYFGLTGNQMPNEQQQNQYAAYEISPQGPAGLNTIGAQLKAAKTPAEAASIWTRSFGVPGDKTEIGRRANGAQRYAGIYAQPQGPQGGQQAPPGVQMGQPGDTTPPAPPGGSGAAYAGGGIGAALAPATAQRPDIRTSPTLRGPGAPVPPAPNPIVGAIQAGRQLAAATPMPANALMAGPGAPSSATPAAPWPATTTTVGNYNNPPPAPAAPVVQPPAQAVPPQAQRGAGWSAPPGYAEAQQEAARGSAQDQVAFRRDLPAAQGRIFTAQQALQALEASKTGGGTGWLQAVNNVIGSYEPGFLKNILGPNYDPATLATNRDLAEKYLTQIAMANASRIGPGTDAKLAAAFTGNPNTHIQNLAAQDVLKVQIGLDRMNQAMGDDMQRENISPQEFANWRQTWARTHDPRAFVMDSIAEDPDRLAAFKESMKNASPQEKAIFRSSLVEAQRMGHVQMALPGQ